MPRPFFHSANPDSFLVLSTDDDPTNQMVIEYLLDGLNIELEIARSGDECLRILRSDIYLPDLVLLDVMMPGKSGLEVLEEIRRSEALKSIPVIMVSALDSDSFMREASRMGCNGFCTKPLTRQVLLSAISEVLPEMRPVLERVDHGSSRVLPIDTFTNAPTIVTPAAKQPLESAGVVTPKVGVATPTARRSREVLRATSPAPAAQQQSPAPAERPQANAAQAAVKRRSFAFDDDYQAPMRQLVPVRLPGSNAAVASAGGTWISPAGKTPISATRAAKQPPPTPDASDSSPLAKVVGGLMYVARKYAEYAS